MSNVLERIVATKQQHIEALKLRFPEESLTPKTSDRSLYQALSAKGAGFILECKKASPSKGLSAKTSIRLPLPMFTAATPPRCRY